VVAQDGHAAERRQGRRDRLGRDRLGQRAVRVDVVAEQQHEVGARAPHPRGHARHERLVDLRRARVQVAHQRDAQAVERARPARQPQRVPADDEPARLDPRRPRDQPGCQRKGG
jgi:7,8-dihydro-6-hydroxymethylpterin-pyrophosphokinase